MEKKAPVYYLIYTIFIITFMLITFFGVGPITFADGPMTERILTAIVVLLIYFIWGFSFARWRKINR